MTHTPLHGPESHTKTAYGISAVELLVKRYGPITLDFNDNLNAAATTSSLVHIESAADVRKAYLAKGGKVTVRLPRNDQENERSNPVIGEVAEVEREMAA